MELFDRTINKLSDLADFRAQRHKVIVSSVINIDVAGYEAKELNFSKELGTALENRSRPRKNRCDDTSPRRRRAESGCCCDG